MRKREQEKAPHWDTFHTVQYLDYLTDPSFQWVSRLFDLSFDDEVVTKTRIGYFLPKVEIKDSIVIIDGRNFLKPIKNDQITYVTI